MAIKSKPVSGTAARGSDAPRLGVSVEAPAGAVLDALRELAEPDSDREELEVAIAPAQEPAWTCLYLSTLVPGLAEALSVVLATSVATWFWDPRAGFARLELRRAGIPTNFYPPNLANPWAPLPADPGALDGDEAGLRQAAVAANVPMGWDPPNKGTIEIRLKL